jgi:hypothetical protein
MEGCALYVCGTATHHVESRHGNVPIVGLSDCISASNCIPNIQSAENTIAELPETHLLQKTSTVQTNHCFRSDIPAPAKFHSRHRQHLRSRILHSLSSRCSFRCPSLHFYTPITTGHMRSRGCTSNCRLSFKVWPPSKRHQTR